MLKLIYGPKGSGKTKQIIDQANSAAKNAKGNVLFVTKSKTYSVNIDFSVKCVYTDDYNINSAESLRGFINGLAAANYDTQYVFIDGIARITKSDLGELESVFESAARLTDITFVFTVSSTVEDMPDFLKKYM